MGHLWNESRPEKKERCEYGQWGCGTKSKQISGKKKQGQFDHRSSAMKKIMILNLKTWKNSSRKLNVPLQVSE